MRVHCLAIADCGQLVPQTFASHCGHDGRQVMLESRSNFQKIALPGYAFTQLVLRMLLIIPLQTGTCLHQKAHPHAVSLPVRPPPSALLVVARTHRQMLAVWCSLHAHHGCSLFGSRSASLQCLDTCLCSRHDIITRAQEHRNRVNI